MPQTTAVLLMQQYEAVLTDAEALALHIAMLLMIVLLARPLVDPSYDLNRLQSLLKLGRLSLGGTVPRVLCGLGPGIGHSVLDGEGRKAGSPFPPLPPRYTPPIVLYSGLAALLTFGGISTIAR